MTVAHQTQPEIKLPAVIRLWRFWLMLAWHDWRRRFRRSLGNDLDGGTAIEESRGRLDCGDGHRLK